MVHVGDYGYVSNVFSTFQYLLPKALFPSAESYAKPVFYHIPLVYVNSGEAVFPIRFHVSFIISPGQSTTLSPNIVRRVKYPTPSVLIAVRNEPGAPEGAQPSKSTKTIVVSTSPPAPVHFWW